MTRLLSWFAGALALGAVGLLLIVFGLWLRVAPPPGHWSVALPIGIGGWRWPVAMSVPKLLQAATDPALARWLDGRRIGSPAGPLALRWDAAAATLHVRCAPCALHVAALGDTPIRLAELRVELRRDGEGRYAGRLASGAVALPFGATANTTTLSMRGDLPPTAIAALVAVLGDAVPEARRARIDGTLAARLALEWPSGRWRIEPVLDAFAVHGLGTEALANARLPAHCSALPPRVSRWLERAVIAAEDQRFAEHGGYDLAELHDAIDGNQRRERSARGASTLTQQLARLLYSGDERSLARKVRELLYAVEMERTLGRGRILRLYLALAPWGDGVCGAEAAARHYFDGESAASLDPLEAAWLAARLRAPGDPAEHIDRRRMAQIVAQMRPMTPALREIWLQKLTDWQPAAAQP